MIYDKVLSENDRLELFSLYKKRFFDGESVQNISSTDTKTISEGSAIGTLVGNLNASDQDSSDFTFSLVQGDGSNDLNNSYFTVSGTQLLVNNSEIDFETTPSLNIYVQASDGVNIFAKALTVSVTNINEAPTDIGISSTTFLETVSASSTIATLSVVDSDTNETHIFTLIDGDGSNDADNSSFTISGTSLIINSTPDYETKTSYNLFINVNDGVNDYAKSFSVSVTDVNELPTDIGLSSSTIYENTSLPSLIGNLSTVDSDLTNTYSYTLANSGDNLDDDNGSFTISGTSLILNSSPDYETKASYNIYINVNDGANNYAKAFTVSVTNINEAPTNLGITSNTINSDAFKFNGTNSYIEIPYADVNHPAEFTIELWVRLDQSTNDFQSPLSSRYGSAPWNNLSGYNFYAVNGLEKWSFTGGSGSWESIDTSPSINGEIYDGNTLKFGIWTHLASTYDGTTYRLYVNGILVGSKTAGYSRVGFNSIPARPLRIGAGRTEGSATYFFNGAVDEVRIWNYARTQTQINYNKSFNLSGQESGLVSYYQFESGTATNKTGVNGTNGTLYNSPTTVSGTVLFPTSGSNSGTVDEESSIGTLVGYLIANDPDTANLTYSLVSGNGSNDQHNSLFTVSGNQLLVASSTISYDTTTSLNVNLGVSDGQNTLTKSFQIAVNDLNRAPTNIVLSSNTVTENASPSTVIGTLSSVDSDTTDTTSFTLAESGDAQDDDNGSFTISGTSLILNSSPDYETKDSYSIYINVNDGANNYTKAFTVSVTNINEAPTDLSFEASASFIEYLVVGGGGAGGYGNSNEGGGGGGAGGYLTGTLSSTSGITYTITVGTGGTGVNNTNSPGGNGGSSSIAGQGITTITALGGGGGGGCNSSGATGASGGGGSGCGSDRPGASGTAGQGNSGGKGRWINNSPGQGNGGGGGGASSAGARGQDRTQGTLGGGGAGTSSDISGSSVTYAAGGDGGPGGPGRTFAASNETGNTGNGGDGGTNRIGGNGANGIVIIRYLGNPIATGGIITQSGGYTIHTFTQVGNSSIAFQGGSGSSSSTSIDEEVSIGTEVGTLTATDSDTTNLTYSLVSGDGSNDQHNSLFSISGNQLLVAGNIDYETNSTLNIYVQVSDGENTYEKAMIINVNDVKEVTSIQVNDIIKTFGDADFDLSATSSNTGAFTYTVTDQNIATVNGSTVTIVGAGSTSITVVQAEDDNFASSTATFTLTVNKTDLIISLEDISKTYGDDDFNLSASSSSTGAYTYSVTNQNIATLNGNTLTIVGAGSTSITVSQAADNNYNTASKTINLSVAKGTPVLSFNDVVKNYGDTSFTIEAQSQTSSGSLTFSSSDNSVVSISGSTATVNGAGSSIITVTQSETANYNTTTTSFTITVNKIDPTLSEFSNVTKTFGDPSFEITPPIKNNDNTGVFTYSSSDPSIASINNNNLTINGAGFVVLTANLALDNNYNSGSISTNVTVEKANQTISIGALPENQPLKDFNSIPLSASSSSNAPIVVSLAQGSAASLSGGVGSYSLVSIQQTGIVTITFTTDDSNNPNYKTVSTTLSINVVKSNQSVSYSNNPPSQITYSENLSITLGASASSGLAPEYAIVSGDNASLNNNILSINDTGQITVEASQPGDVNYNPAVPITSIINVIQAPTTLSSLSVPNKTMQDDDFYLTPVVSNRTGDIIYTSSDPQVAIVSGTLVRIIGVGDATITATQNANSKYLSAEISANFTITIGDSDGDGIVDVSDNCDFVVNPEQLDTDGDGIGDLCDPDLDGDGVTNELDNCPMDYNPDQANNDNDSSGDICDNDDDNDGYSDIQDFFPFDPNEWLDTDRDGIGNNADTDDDNDKYLDTDDAFPLNPREWIDTDGDGIGNNKDKDDDNDGVEDKKDAFPLDESEHTDTDKDGIGNNSDQDDDGDGYLDDHEIECNSDPLSRYKKPRDYDDDMIPDCIDLDDDNDGCPDEEDILPLNEKECLDTDGDGIPDGLDFDADNDGVLDFNDDFPLDPNESKDTDGDGIGDNEDRDDNNDGFPEDPITNGNGEQVIPLFVSELLTPNEPGEESVWKIINIEKYPSMNVKVYNPNGIIMFESWNYQNDWTGTGKDGKPLPTGPYFYRIDRANETTVEEGWMYIFN